jgi:iron complex transport system substrate-binding protein
VVLPKYIKINALVSQSHKFYRFIKLSLSITLTIFLVLACNVDTPKNVENKLSPGLQLPASECRVVKHAMGETCVPINPQRVVVLDNLDSVLALGIKPVGAAQGLEGDFHSNLKEQTAEIVKVGLGGQLSLERILLLKPDLILGLTWNGEEIYDQLSQIAPTVIAEANLHLNWQEWLKTYGEALGKSQVAQKLLSDYNERIEAFRRQMGERLSQTQISVVNFWAGYVRIYMKESFSGQVLDDIGLPRPPAQDKEKVSENLSLELIPQMEGDVIFLLLGGHQESKLAQFTTHPLWSQLKAVKQGRVYEVDSTAWISNWSPVAANLILDDLFKYLIKK